MDLNSPATAPSSASLMGVFGKRLFERSEFPIAAHEAEQRRKQAVGGALFFGYLLLSKQKKVTRLEANKM
ncbi:MAG: hypothetical protein V4440_00030 [Pseudomonadota bacterium]